MSTRTKQLDDYNGTNAGYSSRIQKVSLPEGNPSFGAAVTPNDSTDLPNAGTLYIGVGGTVKVDTLGGDTLEFQNIPDGSFLPILVQRVYATVDNGTIADNIIVLY